MELIEKVVYKNYTINIYLSGDHNDDPRAFSNVGVMLCSHKKYELGDEQLDTDSCHSWEHALVKHLFDENLGKEGFPYNHLECWDNTLDDDELDLILEWIEDNYIVLPLYLYDHSGITISHNPFSCRWDSGQVGWHIVANDIAISECGSIEKAREYLKGELETYDAYIRGDVYGYKINNPFGEEIESLWGFYGYDHEDSGLLDEARSNIDADLERTSFKITYGDNVKNVTIYDNGGCIIRVKDKDEIALSKGEMLELIETVKLLSKEGSLPIELKEYADLFQ